MRRTKIFSVWLLNDQSWGDPTVCSDFFLKCTHLKEERLREKSVRWWINSGCFVWHMEFWSLRSSLPSWQPMGQALWRLQSRDRSQAVGAKELLTLECTSYFSMTGFSHHLFEVGSWIWRKAKERVHGKFLRMWGIFFLILNPNWQRIHHLKTVLSR